MNKEVMVRYHFVGGGYLDYEYLDEEKYSYSVSAFQNGALIIFDKTVINTNNVTYTEIIKGGVMSIDKYY